MTAEYLRKETNRALMFLEIAEKEGNVFSMRVYSNRLAYLESKIDELLETKRSAGYQSIIDEIDAHEAIDAAAY